MNKKNKMEVFRLVSTILFCLYLAVVVYCMFLADGFHRSGYFVDYRYNLTPFQEIYRYPRMKAVHGTWTAFLNLFGNVLVFMPIGFYIPFHYRKIRKSWQVIGLCFIFSLLIELTQLVTKCGVFDVDDLILNTLGGVFGYICYYVAFRGYLIYLRRKRNEVK